MLENLHLVVLCNLFAKTDKETVVQLSGNACIEQGFVLCNSLRVLHLYFNHVMAKFDCIKLPELYSVVLLAILIA